MVNELMEKRQFISVKELHDLGWSNYKIRKLADTGKIVNVNRKWYENTEYNGEISDFYAVPVYAVGGVVCMMSAAVYHEMSTHRPTRVDVAIPRTSRIPESPDWPAMHFYRMSEPRYSIGIIEVNDEGNAFKIYDREKTVCDLMLHRNKLGFEPAMETLRMYASRKDRDINKLMGYAKMLQVEATIRQYLEAIL